MQLTPTSLLAQRIARILLGIAMLGWLSMSGCMGYQFGTAALFPQGIRTVHVPVVRNATFRHDLGQRLTEAIIREIELRTPYKVTHDPMADTTLRCEVTGETKRVLTEDWYDFPRALDGAVQVRASWLDRSGRLLFSNAVIPSDDLTILFSQDSRFVPEAGQSVDTSTQRAIDMLASRIVAQMEARW